MIRYWLSALIALLGLTPAILGAESSTELTAILTRVDGAVQLAGPGVERAPLASLWQTVLAGVTIHVPEGGAAGIVCSNYRFVRLQGPTSWSLTEQACATGKELTPSEYALIAPQAGRFKVVRGLLTLDRDIRADHDEDPLAPMVLSPRDTTLQSPRPAVSWSRVPLATEYRIKWNRHGTVEYDTTLKAEDVTCHVEPGGPEVCVFPWPLDRWDLPPDETFLLQIAARPKIEEPWHWTEPVEIQTQRLSAAQALESRRHNLEQLGLEGATLASARAGLFSGEGLYADAAEAYRQALALTPSPELRVTLADVYLTVGLHGLAEALYRQTLTVDAPAVRAAATFGLGRIEYERGHYREAATDFQKAREAYAALALAEEESAARRAEKKAADRALKN